MGGGASAGPFKPKKHLLTSLGPLSASEMCCRIFVPEYTAGMRFELGKCMENGSAAACALQVTLGSAVLSWSSQKVLHCLEACSIFLASPPWGKWFWITVESLGGASASVSFQMVVFFIGACPDQNAWNWERVPATMGI